jgi:hypothetical protein
MKKCMSGCGGKMMSKGGKVSPVKKMKKGGITQDIVGMPGYNATTRPITMKKGGAKKTLTKAQAGRVIGNPKELSDQIKKGPGVQPPRPYDKPQPADMTRVDSGPMNPYSSTKEANLPTKKEVRKEAREDRQYDRKNARRVKKGFRPLSGPSFKKGGSTSFGMLSVKAGVDKNPKPTAADRIVGAKKKAKFGASVPVQHSPSPGRVRSSSGVGTVPVGARKKMGGSTKRK